MTLNEEGTQRSCTAQKPSARPDALTEKRRNSATVLCLVSCSTMKWKAQKAEELGPESDFRWEQPLSPAEQPVQAVAKAS